MNPAQLARRMVEYSRGNQQDIEHFLKVYAWVQILGRLENLDEDTQLLL